MYIFTLFFRSKQSLFLHFDQVRYKMKCNQVNNNLQQFYCNIISSNIYKLKKPKYETYLQNLIEIYIYLKPIYPIYREVLVYVYVIGHSPLGLFRIIVNKQWSINIQIKHNYV